MYPCSSPCSRTSTSARLLRLIHRRAVREGVGGDSAPAPAAPPRPSEAPRKFAERTRSAVCAGPHPPAECLQRRGECGPRVHPCAQELAGKPPPANCRSRRRSRAAEPASPAGGGGTGGDRWGGLVAPPLEQLARVHAVDGSRLIRTEVQLFPSNPRGVSSLRKRMRGGGAPVTIAWLRLPRSLQIRKTLFFVPFIKRIWVKRRVRRVLLR